MAKTIVLEEFHVTVSAPPGLSKSEGAKALRILKSLRFQTRLREAIRRVFLQYRSLNHVRFIISR